MEGGYIPSRRMLTSGGEVKYVLFISVSRPPETEF